MVRTLTVEAINIEGEPTRAFEEQQRGLRVLINAIDEFVIDLEMEQLPGSQKGSLPIALRVSAYLEETIGLVQGLDEHRVPIEEIMRPPVDVKIAEYQAAVIDQIKRCDEADIEEIGELDEHFQELRAQWHELKTVLLDAAAVRSIPVAPLNSSLEGLRSCLKMAEQLTKATERVHTLSTDKDGEDAQPADAA